jgi:hypothetical protein
LKRHFSGITDLWDFLSTLRDELFEGGSLDDLDEFVDSGWRTNQGEAAVFGSVRKLAPPAFDDGTD